MLCDKILLTENIRYNGITKNAGICRCFLLYKRPVAKNPIFQYNHIGYKQKESIMLTLIFIILKLAKVVNWSWWWILLTLALDGGVFGRII